MISLVKSIDYFDPRTCDARIHIIGCGSVGSTLAELLVRFGLTNIALYDFDKVEAKNIVNQMFFEPDIGKPKTEALRDRLIEVNNDCKDSIKLFNDGWHGQKLAGYVFLCVDSIEIRKQIVEQNMMNPNIKAMFDFRTRLTDSQHYAADWSDEKSKLSFKNSMDFSSEEARAETTMSACGIELGVATTVRLIVGAGVSNFVNFLKDKTKLKKMVLADISNLEIISM